MQVIQGSTNGGSHSCRIDTSPAAPLLNKIVPELKNRNDIHNACSPTAEKSKVRKQRGDQRQSPLLVNKMHKTFTYGQIGSTPSANGFGGSPESFSDKQDASSERNLTEHLENDKLNKIPVNAVKPHPSSPGLTKIPSTSSLLKTSVLQQQRLEGNEGEKQQPRSPQYSLSSHHVTLGTVAKKSSANASKGTLLSQSYDSVHTPSHLPLTQSTKMPRSDSLSHDELNDPYSYNKSAERNSQSLQNSTTQGPSDLSRHNLSPEVSKSVLEGVPSSKKRKKYRSRDYTVNLQGQTSEDRTKPVRLKERRLTFDPVTGQIKPLTPKELHQEEESHEAAILEPPRSETILPTQPAKVPNPFQLTNWKELSRNEIIQSYLSLQSNMLTSSGAQTHGAHFFMTEYLKQQEHSVKEDRQRDGLLPSISVCERPGVSRQVTHEDLQKIHSEPWAGVNGCKDSKGNWYDWTDCISLDCHGDGTNLNILPYVCLD